MRRLYYIIPLSLLLCTSFFSCEKTESVKVITPDITGTGNGLQRY